MKSKTVYSLLAILIGLMIIASGVAVGTVNNAPNQNASLSAEEYWAVVVFMCLCIVRAKQVS
jgi:hypothetical protein